MSIAVILNRKAGSGNARDRETLERIFAAAPTPVEIMAATGSEIRELARKAVARGCDVVVAGGGDGTINAVASALAGSDAALGVLPLGTLNHFSKDLGIPRELDAAARIVLDANVSSVDVGEVNGRIFVNNSSIGVYARLVRFREAEQRRGLWKGVAFVLALMAMFRRFSHLNIRLLVDGRELRRTTPFLFVGNNEYQANGGRLCLTKGSLFLVIACKGGRMGLIFAAVREFFNRLRENRDFEILHPTEFRIESHRKFLTVALDGEVHKIETPLCYRNHPAALKVLTPRQLAK
ncbi:MAG: diacylglycerol kinase family lipid kinase [Acidobacteriota bacterium]|nr:diacylglycerol kinase family lipid kinase [Acidobacteriota bacterium]